MAQLLLKVGSTWSVVIYVGTRYKLTGTFQIYLLNLDGNTIFLTGLMV